MDEMQYKLRSKDPVLISHAISKLLTRVKEAHEKRVDISNVPEYKLLLSKCDADDTVLCASTYQALVLLAEHGITPVPLAIANITSRLSSVKHYSALITAVSHLLQLELKSGIATSSNRSHPYSLGSHQHPFITILIHERYCWRNVLDRAKSMLSDPDISIVRNSVEFLRPVFVYIMCNPSYFSDDCKQRTWHVLNNLCCARQLQLDTLVWFCTNDAKTCVETNRRILELAEASLQNEDAEFCAALVPLIASLAIRLLEYGHDPIFNFDAMAKLANYCDDGVGNITLHLLTEVIAVCPAVYVPDVLKICNRLMDAIDCGSATSHALLACLLKWMAYPSLLLSGSLEAMKNLADRIASRRTTKTRGATANNPILDLICHTDSYVQFYRQMNRCCTGGARSERDTLAWLDDISTAPMDIRYKCRFVLSGHFLGSDDPKVIAVTIGILAQIAREMTSFGSAVLCMILHKLTTARDAKEIALLSLTLPELLVSKENVPIVIHTLDTFYNSSSYTLKLLSIELYAKALESDPRCYRFTSGIVARTIKTDGTWLSRSTCAKVIRDVCRSRPEHAEDLVPMISQILNECSGTDGSAATALAIEGISALCKAAVIGICSTWRVLAPMLNTETRPIVLMAFCKLFGEIPCYPVQNSEDYESLTLDVVQKLWTLVTSSSDVRVIRCALDALASYRFDAMPLVTIPAEWRNDLASGKSYVKCHDATGIDPKSTPSYVPGICWIEMLRNVNASVLPSAGELLMSFVEQELSGFHSRMYNWPRGEPQNFKYLPERSVIRAIGDHLRRHDKSRSCDERITTECLRIFAHEYPKPLPNVKWDFLGTLSAMSRPAEKYCLLIACHNAATSESAKRFVEDHLSVYENESRLDSIPRTGEFLTLYSKLEHLCIAIQPSGLKPFLEVTLNYSTKGVLLNDDEATSDMFMVVMSSYAKALKNNAIQDGNRYLLSKNLEHLLDKIDLKRKNCFPYIAAASEMSMNDVERMTSPSTWWDVSDTELRNAVVLRTELALYLGMNAPLSFLKELIDVGATTPGIHECLLESIQKVQSEVCSRDPVPDWTLDFIAHVQESMKGTSDRHANGISFYCDVSSLCIIASSGVDKLVTRRSLTAVSSVVRCRLLPLATSVLAGRQHWKSKICQIMEWLNSMRTYGIPETYKVAFYNSLISLKDEPPYKNKWITYLS